jgi:hypothetical protein
LGLFQIFFEKFAICVSYYVNNTNDKQLSPVLLLPTLNIASVFALTWIFIIVKILAINLLPVTTTPAIIKNSCNNISLPPPQSKHQGKKHSMNVNRNLTASHQNMKKNFLSLDFSHLSSVSLTLVD